MTWVSSAGTAQKAIVLTWNWNTCPRGTPAEREPPMSRMAHWFSVGAVMLTVFCVPASLTAQGQIPARVRVLTESERIVRWLGHEADIILVVNQGTTLEVLDFDQEKNRYWVILPPDVHGTRKVGWIRASAVEPAVAPVASPS